MIVGTPAPPTGVTVSTAAGPGTITIHWSTPPASASNGAPITGYVITPYKAGVAQPARVFATTVTTQVLSGLTPATSYTFRIAARNSRGTGAYATTKTIIPTAS